MINISSTEPLQKEKKVSCALELHRCATAKNLEAACILTPTVAGKNSPHDFQLPSGYAYLCGFTKRSGDSQNAVVLGRNTTEGYQKDTTENIILNAVETIKRKHLVKKGETIVVTAGDPATNVTKAEGNKLHAPGAGSLLKNGFPKSKLE